VIGALGGSGTRAVARICEELGIFLGRDLNEAHDNLGFTLLFKRPKWLAHATAEDVGRALALFEKTQTGTGEITAAETRFVWRAAIRMAFTGHDHEMRGSGLWPLVRARRLLRADSKLRETSWGWKEPNSHVYLEHLARCFPDLRFIYVLRHGLDMAYSRNRAQLYNWGPRFGVFTKGRAHSCANLEYWCAATRHALEEGPRRLGTRFLRLDFDRLCTEPMAVLPGLMQFLGDTQSDDAAARLARHLSPPASIGRYRLHEWGSLDAAHIDYVRSLGFDVG